MKSSRICGLLIALFFLQFAAPALSQGPERERPERDRAQRWDRMENQRKQDMRKRLKELDKMGKDQRKTKLDSAKLLREIMAEVYAGMDKPTKARVDALSAPERTKLLGRLALEEARARSREAGLVLGSDSEDGAKDPNAAKGHLSRKERKAMHEEFLLQARQRLEQHVEKNGLPKGVSKKRWDEFRSLKGRKFGKALRELSHEHPELIKVVGPPPGLRKVDRDRWLLHQAMRLPPAEHMKHLRKGGRAGMEKEMASRRTRVMECLKDQTGVTKEKLAQLKTLSDKEFMKWVHQRMRPERGPGREPRHGPGDRPGRRGERRPGMGPPPGEGPPPGARSPRERGNHPPRKARGERKPPGEGVSPHPDQRRRPRPSRDRSDRPH